MYIAEEQSWQYNLHVTPYNKQRQMHTLHTEEECILIPFQAVAQMSDKGNCGAEFIYVLPVSQLHSVKIR